MCASVSANICTHIRRIRAEETEKPRFMFGQEKTSSGVFNDQFSFSQTGKFTVLAKHDIWEGSKISTVLMSSQKWGNAGMEDGTNIKGR